TGFDRPRRVATPASDPFFDRPYEPSGTGGAAWEAGGKAPTGASTGTGSSTSSTSSSSATAGVRGLSSSIKPKRKVASLLGGER
ncbi:MAG: hypothetical protein LH480_04255, partial [Rubrivivax sp.]|nr:hypothetical protein [Rubrivivax sp.]